MRDLCDIAWVMRLEEARRDQQALVIAVAAGGGEFVDPVRLLHEEVFTEPVTQPDRDLRRALGLSS